jgi:hypothetical protein
MQSGEGKIEKLPQSHGWKFQWALALLYRLSLANELL